MIQLSDDQKLILGAVGVFIVLSAITLTVGAIFGWFDSRQIQKQENVIEQKTEQVEQSEKQVEEIKQEADETKGEIKVLKEVKKENDLEVNEKSNRRRDAAANRARVRANPVRNVNGTDLHHTLDNADREQ